MASRISRKVCTLGRSGALGTGRWGSIQDHSASDKSVWYALLMLGTLPSHLLKAPFRTVSPRTSVNRDYGRRTDQSLPYLPLCVVPLPNASLSSACGRALISSRSSKKPWLIVSSHPEQWARVALTAHISPPSHNGQSTLR